MSELNEIHKPFNIKQTVITVIIIYLKISLLDFFFDPHNCFSYLNALTRTSVCVIAWVLDIVVLFLTSVEFFLMVDC